MEEIFWVLLELVAELFFQWPMDSLLGRRERRAYESDGILRYGLMALFAIMAGAAMGWGTAYLWPKLWPTSWGGRACMLVLVPLLVGYVSYAVNTAKAGKGDEWLRPWRHALCAALFALAWAITRTLLSAAA